MSKEKETPQHWESTSSSSRKENGEHLPVFNDDNEHYTPYENRWAKIRYVLVRPLLFGPLTVHTFRSIIAEPAAEFLGVMILIIFGNGVDCQVVLSTNTGVAPSPKGVSSLTSSPVFTNLLLRFPVFRTTYLSTSDGQSERAWASGSVVVFQVDISIRLLHWL
jgi:hypothetical protein